MKLRAYVADASLKMGRLPAHDTSRAASRQVRMKLGEGLEAGIVDVVISSDTSSCPVTVCERSGRLMRILVYTEARASTGLHITECGSL